MDIAATVEPGLPALAWLVECEEGRMQARCGPAVEISGRGLFEGSWTGDFPAFDFDHADYIFGTGVRIRDNSPVFVPPSHTLDALYVWLRSGGYCVSNSLAFLCEHARIDLPYAGYGRRFASVVLGIARYRQEIHRNARGRLCRVVYNPFCITNGSVRPGRSAASPGFDDFRSYRSHLADVLRRASDNAACPDRKRTYAPLATCSTGYDSSACAVLARETGCRTAITFGTDRTGKADSGREVGARLGLEVAELPGHAGNWAPDGLAEVEFCASGLGGDDVVFLQAAEALRGRMLVTGFHGDSVWGLDKQAGTTIERGDLSGGSLGELRLRLPFVHLPLPFVGAREWPEIRRIGRSEEMQSYRIGGKYDRPIPRRILEEAGVPRGLFGQEKKMVSSLLFIDRTRLSSESRHDFLEQEARVVGGRKLRYHLRRLAFHGRLTAGRLLPRLQRLFLGDYRIFEHTHPRSGDAVFLWALRRQRRVYRTPPRPAGDSRRKLSS
jgi:hypothetical protein